MEVIAVRAIKLIAVVISVSLIGLGGYAKDFPDMRKILGFINEVGGKPSINLEVVRYFSRTHVGHPIPEFFLNQPLYGIEWLTQLGRMLFGWKSNPKDAFYALAKLSADVKRIDIVENPAEKIFSDPPTGKVKVLKGSLAYDELRIVASFSECLRRAKERFDYFIFQNPEFMLNPITSFSELATISILTLKYEEILKFLERLNTSQYLILLCFDKFIKGVDKFRNSFIAEVEGVSFEVYDRGDDFIVVPNLPAVIIDLGGNDTYFFWRWDQDAKSWTSSALVVVDLGNGKDSYKFDGSRSLYLSLIFDDGGDDSYECTFGCQGGGFFGSEVLVDLGGNDHYRALGIAQGAGLVGTGILIDLGGDDLYESVTFSQGFGEIGGGLLIDFQGNDRYFLKKGKEFPSFQDRSRNLSMGQGCGSGVRADYIENHESIPGGVGLLYDFSGDDEYSAEVFSQGCGYWYGVGGLFDIEGVDRYIGYWYCQGTSAHFGIGVLVDSGGSDSYSCDFQGMGHGHDLGYGILIDFAQGGSDSDSFICKERCLGMGHANGVGIFFNDGGDDEYRAEKHAFGDAITDIYFRQKSIRDIIPTEGIFIDVRGDSDKLFLGGELFNYQSRESGSKSDYLRRIFINKNLMEHQLD